ncbi:MAG: UDP-N-acetylmuramate dehydrogenase [Bacteroidales bacterium]|jgi:UDP-N-acetylmuramate dehydrogenase|nr:UDP-N-acetylmuramate dehydrogenase [Bacteroidales bacterium]
MCKKLISLLPYNTFKINAATSSLVEISDEKQLGKNIPDCYILGGGSNTLFTQDDNGPVLKVANRGIIVEGVVLKIAAGEIWNDVVKFAIDRGLWGIEALVDIPGTVGGATVQNIGAYGAELKDVVVNVEVIDLISGERFILPVDKCEYGYRTSIFKCHPTWLVWSVRVRLSKNKPVATERSIAGSTPFEIASQISLLRSQKLPPLEQYGSAGSFFKNPVVSFEKYEHLSRDFPNISGYVQQNGVKISAGWLIEKCGWKGVRKGNVGVYEKQALVLINFGGATGMEVLNLASEIVADVEKKFGITLVSEVVVR